MSKQPTTSNTSEELARFREEWKEEVRRKREAVSQPASGGSSNNPVLKPSFEAASKFLPVLPVASKEQVLCPHGTSLPVGAVHRGPDTTPSPLGPNLERAVEVYRRAVLCEQQSDLDEALQLYRTAFRMNPNVERAYHNTEARFHLTATPPAQGQPITVANMHPPVDDVTQRLKALDVHTAFVPTAEGGGTVPAKSLASIIAGWPHELEFVPEDERELVILQMLPVELLIVVLRKLDTTTLERFALVSRRARALTLDMTMWRDFVVSVYKPPQLRDARKLHELLRTYMGDHRRLYIEQPRVRLDGVYIACKAMLVTNPLKEYIGLLRLHDSRPGLSENVWVNVNHLVTYHRRFYPTGQVLSLLANEGLPPQQIIPILKPALQMKGLFIGSWRLDGTTVYIERLLDPRPPTGSTTRYAFQMILELHTKPVGRWNRLDFVAYDSVNMESGETTPLALKNERPFWFSKVRSYS